MTPPTVPPAREGQPAPEGQPPTSVPSTHEGQPPPIPRLGTGIPPLSILIDYDGTISLTDITEQLLAQFVSDVVWEDAEASYDAGRMGSRRLMAWEVSLIDADPDALRSFAASQPHDPGFVPFIRRAQAAGIPVEIVSDGYGFFIQPALAALGVGDLPVVTARTTFEGRRASIEFVNGHPTCLVCGTCKRQRVLAHRASGRRVVYIGDGESDRYVAGYSDIVFAKRSLERICLEAGWEFRRWTAFREIDAWLETTLVAWGDDPHTLEPVPDGAAPPRGYFCGPEVWGAGLEDPPPGSWPP